MEKNERVASEERAASGGDDLAAVNAIVTALRPFDAEQQNRIVQSALTLLGLAVSSGSRSGSGSGSVDSGEGNDQRQADVPAPRDIRELREQKQPRTANEMAAVTAYYLAKLAPAEMHQDFITAADVTKYFDQANYPQPGDAISTLFNAKSAGYFDALGGGKFRLNPVGFNLVKHTLPRKGESATKVRLGTRPRRSARRQSSKKAVKPSKSGKKQ